MGVGMSKKLGEIGREVVELSDMEFVDPDTVDWGDAPETERLFVYTKAERLELIKAAIMAWLEERAFAVTYGSDMEKFISELDL